MAHTARLSVLTDDLVHSITGVQKTSREFKSHKDVALRGIKSQAHLRTNQFDIQNILNGLLEKFQVKDRDDLAEALSDRLKELGDLTSRWTPEILDLFLNLSDRPLEKSNVADLELLKPPEPEPELTWADIIAEDPLNEVGIWDDIDYAAQSSADEDGVEEDVAPAPTNPAKVATSDVDQEIILAENLIQQSDLTNFSKVKKSQFWKAEPVTVEARGNLEERREKFTITELQAVKEVLLMLLGLPTSLFILSSSTNLIIPSGKYTLGTTDSFTFMDTLTELAALGTDLQTLRLWVKTNQSASLIQAFQDALGRRLQQFQTSIADINTKILTPKTSMVVSLLHIHERIQTIAKPFLPLVEIVSAIRSDCQPFDYLELLFDAICVQQLTGSVQDVEFCGRIFFECLDIYLRPFRRWMEEGVIQAEHEDFFIAEVGETDLPGLWHDRYRLRTLSNGSLYAPSFLSPAANKILNTGKSVAFLRELGYDFRNEEIEPSIDYDTVAQQQSKSMIAPFPELFGIVFERWIRSRFTVASKYLRQKLEVDLGLSKAMDSLEFLYFSKDGTSFQAFADTIFEKMDGRSHWKDRFILTEIAQSSFGQVDCLDVEKISVRYGSGGGKKARGISTLGNFVIEYSVSWPLLNVLRRKSFMVYQQIFVLLLQIYRAKYLVRQTIKSMDALNTPRSVKIRLRQRLTWFLDILQAHLTFTVLEHETGKMREKMTSVEDIDSMSKIHGEYITRLHAQCFLSKNLAPIYEAIISILDLSLAFSSITSQSTEPKPTVSSVNQAQQRTRRRENHARLRRLRSNSSADSDSEDESEEHQGADDYDGDAKTPVALEGSLDNKMQKMHEQFERQTAFIVAGLKGVSRAGGEQSWDMLAERLDWRSSSVYGIPDSL